MTLTQLDNSEQFLVANKAKFVVLLVDAEFTESKDLIVEASASIEQFAKANPGDVVAALVDAEKDSEFISKLSIVSVPIVVCISNNGKSVKKVDNLLPSKLTSILKEELIKSQKLFVNDVNQVSDPKEKFKDYLKQLTTRAPVMIFMKGQPSAPRCGFSKQLVAIFAKYDIKYDSFDILEDEDVRQGLKEHSDWPTYPQIYVKGEFIGGLDILKQMEESDELESTFKV